MRTPAVTDDGRNTILKALHARSPELVERAAVRIVEAGDWPVEPHPARLRERLSTAIAVVLNLLQKGPGASEGAELARVAALCAGDGAPFAPVMQSVDSVASLLVDDLATSVQVLPRAARDAVLGATVEDVAVIAATMRLDVDFYYQQRLDAPRFDLSWFRSLDPGPPYTLVVAIPISPEADADRLGRLLERHLLVVAARHASTDSHVTVVAAAPHATTQDALLDLANEARALLLLHPSADDACHLEAQYRWTRSSLAGIRRLAGRSPTALFPRQMAAVAAVQSAPLAARAAFVRATLGGVLVLRPHRAQPFLDVIAEHCAGVAPSAIAERLGLHPKTVAYRGRRMHQHTGLNIGEPDERLRLMLGYQAWRLNQPSLPPLGSADWKCLSASDQGIGSGMQT